MKIYFWLLSQHTFKIYAIIDVILCIVSLRPPDGEPQALRLYHWHESVHLRTFIQNLWSRALRQTGCYLYFPSGGHQCGTWHRGGVKPWDFVKINALVPKPFALSLLGILSRRRCVGNPQRGSCQSRQKCAAKPSARARPVQKMLQKLMWDFCRREYVKECDATAEPTTVDSIFSISPFLLFLLAGCFSVKNSYIFLKYYLHFNNDWMERRNTLMGYCSAVMPEAVFFCLTFHEHISFMLT